MLAQPTSPSADENETETDKVLTLSTFNVTGTQNRYLVSNSTTATGMGAAIVDIPVAISVVSEQFIQDKNAYTLQDVMNYTPGVSTTGKTEAASMTGNYGFSIRGFPATNQQDGYNINLGTGSTFGVDRVEVIKGPSAVFNGIIAPGGLINVIYKRPSFTPSGYIEGQVGSYDATALRLMATGPIKLPSWLPGRAAYLAGGNLKDAEAWRDHVSTNEQMGLFGFTYEPYEKLSFMVRYRDSENLNQAGSTWPRTHTGWEESGLPWDYNQRTWLNANFSTAEPYNSLRDPANVPGGYRFNANGPQNFNNATLQSINSEIDLNVNDHITIRYGFLYGSYWNEFMRFEVLDGSPDPTNFWSYNTGGEYRASKNYNFMHKIEAAFQFDTWKASHSLLVGYSDSTSESWANNRLGGNGRIPKSWFAANPYNPMVDPPILIEDLLNSYFPNTASYKGSRHTADNTVTGLYFADQIEMFDDRFRMLLGGRHTKQDALNRNNGVRQVASDFTPQVGVIFRPFADASPLKGTTIFANYSESFQPSSRVDYYGNTAPAAHGEGKEIGVKAEWLDGKLSGTLSYFENTKNNVAHQDVDREALLGVSPLFTLSGEETAKGAELEMYWTPSSNLQVGFNYTYIPFAKTVENIQVPQQVGVRFGSTPVHRANLFSRYSVPSGPLEGFFVGGGLIAQSELTGILQGAWVTSGNKVDSFVMLDAFVGYKTKWNDRDLTMTLQVKNLNNHRYFAWDAYSPIEPRTFYFTTRLSLF